jgi:hypothetical protein
MSIWAKIAKYGGSALKGAGSVAKQGLKSASNTAVHPTQALKGAGSAMKTAAVGSAAGYVAWQNLVNDKSMVEIASDVVVGKDTTEKISEAVEDVKGLKNKAGEAVDAVNSAMGDINSKWSGMSNFLDVFLQVSSRLAGFVIRLLVVLLVAVLYSKSHSLQRLAHLV